MQRAPTPELRQAMESASAYMKAGIGFICVPYINEEEKFELTNQAYDAMERMKKLIEHGG